MHPSAKTYHLSGYQARDAEVIDYRMYELAGTGLQFRGPPPASLASGSYFACIGGAQTLGCFCGSPYPALLEAEIGLPALNLGYGGAGPEFFAGHSALLRHVNNARFAVLQVMSGRSQSNSYYTCEGLEYVTLTATGERMGAFEAFDRLLSGPAPLAAVPKLGRGLANRVARPRVRELVDEIRAAWSVSMETLLDRIEVPVVLIWFSKRGRDYVESYQRVRALFGGYPQLINAAMIAPLKARVEASSGHYVEVVSSRGSPQPLYSRFTGEPVTVETANDRPDLASEAWNANAYYPSPEMHEDAAAALLGPCRSLTG